MDSGKVKVKSKNKRKGKKITIEVTNYKSKEKIRTKRSSVKPNTSIGSADDEDFLLERKLSEKNEVERKESIKKEKRESRELIKDKEEEQSEKETDNERKSKSKKSKMSKSKSRSKKKTDSNTSNKKIKSKMSKEKIEEEEETVKETMSPVEISDWPIIPFYDEDEISEFVRDYLPRRRIPKRKLVNSRIAEKRFQRSVLEAADELSNDFHMRFLEKIVCNKDMKNIIDPQNPESSFEGIKKGFLFYLNSSGRYLILREHLRHSVSSLIQQKSMEMRRTGFASHTDFQCFLNDMFINLSNQIHQVLSEANDSEISPICDKVKSTADEIDEARCEHEKRLFDLNLYAQEALAQDDFENARRIYLKIISMSEGEGNDEYWVEFAKMWLLKGEDRIAEICAQEALRLNRHNINALVIVGVILCVRKEKLGLKFLHGALNEKPLSPELLVILGFAYSLFENEVAADFFYKKGKLIHEMLKGLDPALVADEMKKLRELYNMQMGGIEVLTDSGGEKESRVQTANLDDLTKTTENGDLKEIVSARTLREVKSDISVNVKEPLSGNNVRPVSTNERPFTAFSVDGSYFPLQSACINEQKTHYPWDNIGLDECNVLDSQLPEMIIPSILIGRDVTKPADRIKKSPLRPVKTPFSLDTDVHLKSEFDTAMDELSKDNAKEMQIAEGDEVREEDLNSLKNSSFAKIFSDRFGSQYIWAAQFLLNLHLFDFLDGILAIELRKEKSRTPDFLYLYGLSLYMRGKEKNSLDFVNEGIENDPRNSILWALKGHCHYKLEDEGNAIDSYKKSVNLPRKEDDNRLVFLRLGTLFMDKGELEIAKRVFLKGVHFYKSPYMWLSVGNAAYYLQELSQAEVAFSEANRIDNSDPTIWGHLTLINLALGSKTLAEQSYKWAIRFGLQVGKLMEEIRRMQREKGFGDPSFPKVPNCLTHEFYLRRLGKLGPLDAYKEILNYEPQPTGILFYDTMREVDLKKVLSNAHKETLRAKILALVKTEANKMKDHSNEKNCAEKYGEHEMANNEDEFQDPRDPHDPHQHGMIEQDFIHNKQDEDFEEIYLNVEHPNLLEAHNALNRDCSSLEPNSIEVKNEINLKMNKRII